VVNVLNVSHCWAPLLFVWAVPSLYCSIFITDFYESFSGMLLAFGRLIVLLRVQRLKGVTVVTIVTVTLMHVLVVLCRFADTVHVILAIVRFHAVLFTAFLGISH
jgi:hypothetical protein